MGCGGGVHLHHVWEESDQGERIFLGGTEVRIKSHEESPCRWQVLAVPIMTRRGQLDWREERPDLCRALLSQVGLGHR